MGDIEKSIAASEIQIQELEEKIGSWKNQINEIRGQLGREPEELKSPDESKLENLKNRHNELLEEKENTESTQQLGEAMDMLAKLGPLEIKIVSATGKLPNGKELETSKGKIKPDVAKELAKAVENGVKKITKAILHTALAVVKGVVGAAFEVAKGTPAAMESAPEHSVSE